MNKLPIMLKKILASRNMTAKELASLSGLSVSRISDLLHGRTPSLKNLIIIADCLDVSTDFLIKGTQDKSSKEIQVEDIGHEVQKIFELQDTFKITITVSKDNQGKKK